MAGRDTAHKVTGIEKAAEVQVAGAQLSWVEQSGSLLAAHSHSEAAEAVVWPSGP